MMRPSRPVILVNVNLALSEAGPEPSSAYSGSVGVMVDSAQQMLSGEFIDQKMRAAQFK
jgi:hypothetical protein